MAARAFLTLVALLCLGASASEARTFKPGSARARWSIKTSVLAGADLAHPKNVPLDKLLGLGDVPGVSAQDCRFTSVRIPDALQGLHEGDMIRTKGWVHLVACEGDGDYHLQISNSKTSGNQCLVVEMPMDKATFEKDAKLRGLYAKLRPFLRRELLHDENKEFSEAGNWMKSEVYMSITGQLFFDDWHVGGEPRGKSPKGHPGKAATLWEIHPVTDIQFAPKPH